MSGYDALIFGLWAFDFIAGFFMLLALVWVGFEMVIEHGERRSGAARSGPWQLLDW